MRKIEFYGPFTSNPTPAFKFGAGICLQRIHHCDIWDDDRVESYDVTRYDLVAGFLCWLVSVSVYGKRYNHTNFCEICGEAKPVNDKHLNCGK